MFLALLFCLEVSIIERRRGPFAVGTESLLPNLLFPVCVQILFKDKTLSRNKPY